MMVMVLLKVVVLVMLRWVVMLVSRWELDWKLIGFVMVLVLLRVLLDWMVKVEVLEVFLINKVLVEMVVVLE